MRANRRQSLAELCNPKLVRLAQVPNFTADREEWLGANGSHDYNLGVPQSLKHTSNTSKLETVQMDKFLR